MNNVQLVVDIKATKQILWVCIWAKHSKIGPKIRVFAFCHVLKVAPLVFPDIAQDSSLGQYLTSSRAETSKKNL